MSKELFEHRYGNGNSARTVVDCDTMSGILRSLNHGEDPPMLHFWSLDCEGCEGIALETLDWTKTQVGVLHAELKPGSSCGGDVPKCERILRKNGMVRWTTFGADQVWYNRKYFHGSDMIPVDKDHDFVQPWLVLNEMLKDYGFHVAEYSHSYVENTRKELDAIHERIVAQTCVLLPQYC